MGRITKSDLDKVETFRIVLLPRDGRVVPGSTYNTKVTKLEK